MGRNRGKVPAMVPLALAVAAAAALAVALGAPPQELCTSPVRVFQMYNSSGLLMAPSASGSADGGSNLVGAVMGFNDPLFFAGGTDNQIGNMRWLCQELSAGADTTTPGYYCVYTLKFGPYGSISAVGEYWMYQDAEFENAVIGGTGMFRGASGSLNVTTLEEGSRWRYDIYLMQKPNCTTS